MHTNTGMIAYRDWSLLLWIIGGLMLLAGLAAAAIGPTEAYVYYAFSEGGKYYYEGFGFGSFMFAYIAVQVIGYYAIAVILTVLGIGHLKRRRWARSLTLTLLWAWLVAGLPLTLAAYAMLFLSKALTLPVIIAVLVIAPFIYPILPLLLMRFYQSRSVRLTFEAADPDPPLLDRIPLAIRGLCTLLILTIITLHGSLLLHGVFPFFGRLLTGMDGVLALDVTVIVLVACTWALWQQKWWGWWSALIATGALMLSGIMTFSRVTLRDLLIAMQFPPYEMQLFQNVPILDGTYGLLSVAPFAVLLIAILWVWRYITKSAAVTFVQPSA